MLPVHKLHIDIFFTCATIITRISNTKTKNKTRLKMSPLMPNSRKKQWLPRKDM